MKNQNTIICIILAAVSIYFVYRSVYTYNNIENFTDTKEKTSCELNCEQKCGGTNVCGTCKTCRGLGAWSAQCLNISKDQCDSYPSNMYKWCGN